MNFNKIDRALPGVGIENALIILPLEGLRNLGVGQNVL